MAESAADRAAFLDPDDFGSAATYTPSGGAAASINVMLDLPHEDVSLGDLGMLQVGYTAMIRVDDVTTPADGDTLVVGARTFTVRNARQDQSGDFWKVDLELQ